MLEKFKIYIINLKSSKERKKNILKELDRQNLKNFELIEAVDGNKLNEEEINLHTFKNEKNFNPWGPKLTNSQIGCALSHIKIYKNFLQSRFEYAFILEDDAIFLDNFTTNLKNFILKNLKFKKQILLLSEIKEFYKTPIDSMENYNLVKVTNAFFTHAYFINKEAAKSIMKFNYPIKTWADNFVLFKLYCNVELTGLNPYLLDQDKTNFFSTIKLQKKFKKNFLLRRFLYKLKNKILKQLLRFDGH
jgi:glycosyl transferase family 25